MSDMTAAPNFDPLDPLALGTLLSDDEIAVRDTVAKAWMPPADRSRP